MSETYRDLPFDTVLSSMFPGLAQFNPKRCRGGCDPPTGQEIGCHISRNDPNVLKLPDFFKNDVGPKVKESFWAYLE